jgi:DNA-binding GntR family transcriptional regulator
MTELTAERFSLPPNVATFVADAIEQSILDGRIAPGTPLLQLDLAASFGVSRVPVRDALAILEQRHLAVRVPRRGVIVRPITPETVRDVFGVRRLLEAEVTRLAVMHITPAELTSLDSIVVQQRAAAASASVVGADAALRELRTLDREFHAVIWHACANAVLEELVGTVWLRALQARAVGHRVPGWGAKSIDRHARIVEALKRQDAAAAIDAALVAVDEAQAEILSQLQKAETPPV